MEKCVDRMQHAPHGAAQSHTVQFLTVAFVNQLPSPSAASSFSTAVAQKKDYNNKGSKIFEDSVFILSEKVGMGGD